MTPQETDPDLPVSVQERLVGAWPAWPAAGSGHWEQQCIMGPLEGGRHFLHQSLASGQTQGGNTAPPFNRKLD